MYITHFGSHEIFEVPIVLSEVTSAIRAGIGVAPNRSSSVADDIRNRKRGDQISQPF